MTTHTTEQHTMSRPPRRSALPWVIAGAVVVVAGVAVTLVLTTGDAESPDRNAAAPKTTASGDERGGEYDLSTPEAAAKAFAAAAETGSGDTLLELACVSRPACVSEHAAGLSEAQLTETRDVIRDGVYELAEHLKGAEFAIPIDGAAPGTKDVPYRTPAMTGDAYLTLTFVQSEDDWLYYSPTG
ncbi:hypothetical protein [Actinophytocola sp.]|uniref:hypothetical protein n=1 Tax=Actinophytocola sp. TaxID=1872138 RepID=UPI002ED4E015